MHVYCICTLISKFTTSLPCYNSYLSFQLSKTGVKYKNMYQRHLLHIYLVPFLKRKKRKKRPAHVCLELTFDTTTVGQARPWLYHTTCNYFFFFPERERIIKSLIYTHRQKKKSFFSLSVVQVQGIPHVMVELVSR